jgi:hypothetical protein
MEAIFVVLMFGVFAVVGWVIPIRLGLRQAREKDRSPEWMWFGIHPFSGWVMYFVLKSLPALKSCPNCTEKVKAHAKVCPYCLHQYGA